MPSRSSPCTASGNITLMVGMTITDLEGIAGNITLNTPLMEAYSEATSMNGAMSGDFPDTFAGTKCRELDGKRDKGGC